MLQPLNRRTWAPSGKTPVQYAWDRHDRLSVIAALLYRPRSGRLSLHFSVLDHNVKTPDFLAFLLELRRLTRRPIILVCDRLNAHRSAVRQLKELRSRLAEGRMAAALCSRSEPGRSHAKYSDLANRVPDDVFQLCELVGQSLNDQHFRPPLLQSYFRRARLTLNARAGFKTGLI